MIARRALVLVVALCALAACSGASDRRRTIDATLAAVNQARDTFVTVDATAQSAIVETAKSLEEGTRHLVTYRRSRELVVEAFAAAYRAIAIAATTDGDAPLKTMVLVAQALADTYAGFRDAVNKREIP